MPKIITDELTGLIIVIFAWLATMLIIALFYGTIQRGVKNPRQSIFEYDENHDRLVEDSDGFTYKEYSASYKFKADGKYYQTGTINLRDEFENFVGNTVIYNSENPNDFIIKSSTGTNIVIGIITLGGIVVILVFFYLTR